MNSGTSGALTEPEITDRLSEQTGLNYTRFLLRETRPSTRKQKQRPLTEQNNTKTDDAFVYILFTLNLKTFFACLFNVYTRVI